MEINMRKILILLVLSFFICSYAYAIDAMYERNRPYEVKGWHVCVVDDDIDATAELVTELDTTYLQMTSTYDTLEVVSSDAADTTQSITVHGVYDGEKTSATFALNGTDAVCGATYFHYIDYAEVDAECAGIITIRRATADVFITSIPAGILNTAIAQHFNGQYNSFITGWSCGVLTTTGNVTFELRWYPDDNDSRCFLTGYIVLDTIYIDGSVTSPYNAPPVVFPQPIKLPAGSWLAVFATGSTTDCDGKVTVQGYDVLN